MMAFGTIITIISVPLIQSYGVSIDPLPTALLALPIAIVASIALALLIDFSIYKFHRRVHSKSIIFLIVSIGVMFMLDGVNKLILGPNEVNFADGARFFIKASEWKRSTIFSEGVTVRSTQIITVLMSISTVLILLYFLQKTRTGKSMRAYSDNKNLALLSGINPHRVVMLTWIITATLTAIGGTLYGLDKGYQPYTYFQILLPIFAAAIVGGLGNPLGAIAGGYIIAFSEVLLTYAYKKFVLYLLPVHVEFDGLLQLLSTEYKNAISFVILVIVLLIRPTGIFKGKVV